MLPAICHLRVESRLRLCQEACLQTNLKILGCHTQVLPIYEPGLDEIVKAARGRNLFFSSDSHKHVADGDVIFVRCVGIASPLLRLSRRKLLVCTQSFCIHPEMHRC